jgi:hypothetical protein
MGESLLLITLITLIVQTIRRARPVVLENPVIIQRPVQYHITPAPQLNCAQTFIELIAKQFTQLHPPERDLHTQYFKVRHCKAFSQDESSYLLAITSRGGVLYFQAVNPKSYAASCGQQLQDLVRIFRVCAAAPSILRTCG